MFIISLEIDLLFGVESVENGGALNGVISYRFFHLNSKEGDSLAKVLLELPVPQGVVATVIEEVVVGLHVCFHFGEERLRVIIAALSPHVLWDCRVIRLDPLLQGCHFFMEL